MDEKEIDWRGSSYKDLIRMPEEVRRTFGYALSLAQNGMRHPDTKQLTSFKPATIEITVTFEATASVWNPGVIDEYRAIITEVP